MRLRLTFIQELFYTPLGGFRMRDLIKEGVRDRVDDRSLKGKSMEEA